MEEEKELLHHHENISDENILNKNNITKEKLLVYEKSSENVGGYADELSYCPKRSIILSNNHNVFVSLSFL